MTVSEMATALAWHYALQYADPNTLLSLSSEDIEVGDANGAGQGHRALRQWADAAAARGDAGRVYVHDGVVVLELLPPGESGDAASTAVAFRVVDDHVTSVFHHPSLAAALAATELTEDDLAR